MKEIVLDNGLVIQYRKNAVYFLYKNNTNDKGYTYPFWEDQTPYTKRRELEIKFNLNEIEFKDFLKTLNEISCIAWDNIEPKLAISLSMDYWEYYDRDFDSNGYLSIKNDGIYLEGPAQPKTENKYNRLYKFDKRKMASFLYDLEIKVNS